MPFIPDTAAAGVADQAAPDSLDFTALIAADSGTGVKSGGAVTQHAGSTLTVDVAAGTGFSGPTAVTWSATTVTCGTADATNPRYDLVVVSPTGTVSIVAGTPSAVGSGLVFPSYTTGYIWLAAIRVAATTTAIVTANIVDKRITVSGEPLANSKALVGKLRGFGHSYIGTDINAGTWAPDMKSDRVLARFLNLPGEAVENYAHSGSRLSDELVPGGWVSVARRLNPSAALNSMGVAGNSTPYVGRGGVYLNAWPAINDMAVGVTTAIRAAYTDTLFAVINRERASYFAPSDAFLGFTYGAGFTATTATAFNSGSQYYKATVTTSATITWTVPSDYTGQALCFYFIGMPGTTGGTVTFSGTAGITGTVYTGARQVTSSGKHSYICKRVTGLTSANAGQSVVITATSFDSGGTIIFDGMSIEADNPPLILVYNTARLLAAGYTFYGSVFGDSDVATWNTDINTTCALFTDGLVKVVDIDTALGKSATNFNADGYHPNELGHYKIANAALNVLNLAYPSLNNAGNAPLPMGLRQGCIPGQWYTSPATSFSTAVTVLNNCFASPFFVSEWTAIDTVAIDTSTVLASSKCRVAIYFSDESMGRPGLLYTDLGDVPTTTLALGGTTSVSNFWLPPGLWWIVTLVEATAGATVRTITSTSQWIPSVAGATQNAGWLATGVTALPNVYPITAALTGAVPKTSLKATTGRQP